MRMSDKAKVKWQIKRDIFTIKAYTSFNILREGNSRFLDALGGDKY